MIHVAINLRQHTFTFLPGYDSTLCTLLPSMSDVLLMGEVTARGIEPRSLGLSSLREEERGKPRRECTEPGFGLSMVDLVVAAVKDLNP